jgi:hypothetical protein
VADFVCTRLQAVSVQTRQEQGETRRENSRPKRRKDP